MTLVHKELLCLYDRMTVQKNTVSVKSRINTPTIIFNILALVFLFVLLLLTAITYFRNESSYGMLIIPFFILAPAIPIAGILNIIAGVKMEKSGKVFLSTVAYVLASIFLGLTAITIFNQLLI